jgi:hypothetical protein
MREADEKRQDLMAAVQLGEDQIARGHYQHYTPELFETIKRNSIEKAKPDHPLNPEVLPQLSLDSLSDQAQADYEDILAYTLRTWGAQ